MTMRVDKPMRRLGVMGGTFDPIHVGHLIAASEALHVFELDRVLFIPAGQPWQKIDYSDAEDRFLMTSLAAGLHPRFAASRMELDRKGPTYSVDTLVELGDFYPDLHMFLIVGADAAQQLSTWHEAERLAGLAEVVVVTRPGFTPQPPEGPGAPRVHHLDIPAVDVSSSEIRRRVKAGEPIDFMVPIDVAGFISQRGLYLEASEKPR